jgi:crotonobetainyl-CoA:carnitine CoA-transferase CaiB-like acyl-CoA transferase
VDHQALAHLAHGQRAALIIDFTQVYLGPSATQMLGDFGADVIKAPASS